MHRVEMEQWICRREGLQELTRQNLEALQLDKLNTMLKRLRQRGGLFADLPEKIASMEELRTLPFTTPQMLRDHPGQFLMCSQSEVSRIISEATSGTTGGAKRVFYTDQDLKNTVDFFASGIHEMLSEGQKCLIAFPLSGPSGLGDLIAKAVEKLGAIPVPTGFGLSYGELCQIIRDQRPETYIGFPVPLLSLIRLFGSDFPIRRALISGDSCPKGVWDALSGTVKLYPHYGSRETALGGAVTCSAFEGMHLRENHILAEIIDRDGNPLPDGQWGELVLTTIGLEAMSLLRYRTGDITRFIPGPCPCGGVTRRLDQVIREETGPVSIEKLDSTLFSEPEIIDYRAEYDGILHISAMIKQTAPDLGARIRNIYPGIETRISYTCAKGDDHPAYPGKRHILYREED